MRYLFVAILFAFAGMIFGAFELAKCLVGESNEWIGLMYFIIFLVAGVIFMGCLDGIVHSQEDYDENHKH